MARRAPNPFSLQALAPDAPFCDRKVELRELLSYARSGANVVLFSPRRQGKTSLVHRVQARLAREGAWTMFVDFFGVGSVDDAAARMAKAAFAVAHAREPWWRKALEAVRAFRPVLKPDPQGGIGLTVEAAPAGPAGVELLDDTMESFGRLIRRAGAAVHVVLDEFQELATLREAPRIEAVLRSHIQGQRASYFFVGSRRRMLLGIFNDRQRPFFRSAVNYPVPPLPREALAEFVAERFRSRGKKCSIEAARAIAELADGQPYYAQKLGFFVFERAPTATRPDVRRGWEDLLESERPVFEASLQGLSPHQRNLLRSLAKEPARHLLSSSYLRRHALGSVGGIQSSIRHLADLDLAELDEAAGVWRLVDPALASWLRARDVDKLRPRRRAQKRTTTE